MDMQRFRKAALHRPTAEVEVPELKGLLFDDSEPPVLHVRGLTFNEQFLAREHLRQNSIATALKAAVDKAAEQDTKELQEVVAKLLAGGATETRTSGETAYRVEVVLRGTVDSEGKPLFQRQDVVKLAEHFPLQFHAVSQKILELSGDPSNLGEDLNGHGQITVSAPH